MFALTDIPIEGELLKDKLRDDGAGALITFEGVVRNNNEGKAVLGLSYEAYDILAAAEAERIFAEARRLHKIINCLLVHRVGDLKIGEAAIFVGVAAAHRDEAYLGSRYIIDQAKARLPVWKKEHYADGSANWVNCRHNHSEVEHASNR